MLTKTEEDRIKKLIEIWHQAYRQTTNSRETLMGREDLKISKYYKKINSNIF